MKKISFLLACLAAAISVHPVSAHPADLYFQTVTARLTPEGAQITWDILPGVILAQVAWLEADLNGDAAISAEEAGGWAESVLDEFQLTLDGRPLEVRIEAVEWPSSLPEIQNENVPIRIRLGAEWPGNLQPGQELIIRDLYNVETSLTFFYLSSAAALKFGLPDQQGGNLTVRFESAGAELLTAWESDKPNIPGLVQALGLGETAQQAADQVPQKQGISAILEGLLRARESSPWFIAAALAIAAIVGALHALTPGHGKTVVAAYLIGSRGTLRHAVFLGVIVTLTHTGSVFLLGLVTLAASQYILPASLFPVLEILSGVLIVGLGASLLYQRVRAWMSNRSRSSEITILNTKDIKEHKGRTVLNAREHEHDHRDGQVHHHDQGHTHDHEIPDPSAINLRTLAALGVSGGLVPCPEAIAILLLAISLSRVLLGLSLILAFSLGLAFILIAIGMVMVQSKRLFARLRFLDRWAYAVPVLSAGIVLLLGLGLTFGAVRNARAFTGPADSASVESVPAFDLERARVLFVSPDEDKRNQIHAVPAAGGEITRLTQEPQGVRDFSVSPDGAWLAYSASDETGGTNLWRLDTRSMQRTRLLACPTALCGKMIWSRDGGRALYSRLGMTSEEAALGIPSVWWLDVSSGETGPVFQDSRVPTLNFDWSPGGTWLSYTSGLIPEIKINNLQTGEGYAIPTRTGGHLAWSPAEEAFLLADLQESNGNGIQKVLRFRAGSREGAFLIDDLDFNEFDPAWSPDGRWIAMIRYEASAGGSSSGDQIWLVKPDGSGAAPLTEDADTLHGKPVWSPDGQYLLFTYSAISDPLPRLRILEIGTGKSRELSSSGTQPVWLP
jgi:nickel/cobalt exporter